MTTRRARRSVKPKPRRHPVEEFTGKPVPPGPIIFADTQSSRWPSSDRRLGRRRSRGSLCDIPVELPRRHRQRRRCSRDTRPVYPALVEICRTARAAVPLDAEAARKLLRGEFPPAPHLEDRRSERLSHRLLRADRRWLARCRPTTSRCRFTAGRATSCTWGASARPRAFPTPAAWCAASRAASTCRISIAPRSRTARSRRATWRSAISRTRTISCSSRSRARRASGSPTARCCASITTRTTATPTRRSAAS